MNPGTEYKILPFVESFSGYSLRGEILMLPLGHLAPLRAGDQVPRVATTGLMKFANVLTPPLSPGSMPSMTPSTDDPPLANNKKKGGFTEDALINTY